MTVEAMEVTVADKDNKDKENEGEKKDPETLSFEDLKEQIRLVERSLVSKEPRFLLRVLRAIPSTRRKLTAPLLHTLILAFYHKAENKSEKEALVQFVPLGDAPEVKSSGRQRSAALLPEVDVYIHLLVLLYLLDSEKLVQAQKCSDQLMTKVSAHSNRRSLDILSARCYFYHSRVYELTGNFEDVRSFLHNRLTQASLRADHDGQAALINCLLRNYLHYGLYEQAQRLVAKLEFPAQSANNNQLARYHYYMGRIRAIQLDYSAAHNHLTQAMRKAPGHTAVGFRQAVQKLAVLVELLLGDIPDRQVFRAAVMRKPLAPYLQLAQAVRLGNLQHFQQTLNQHKAQFDKDNTFMLIQRLRHNVIKTGLRGIALSYSRIALQDVANKLTLGSREDAEFIVAKAIRDGVIEAVIDHEHGYMQSKETVDVYCTREPQSVYHQRISFCLDIHNQSVKAMRYPPKAYNKDLESAEERREREQQDLELAKEMAEEDDDSFT